MALSSAGSATLTLALHTTQSGLQVNQSALDAVSQNIVNVNSEGYSRKVVQMEQRVVNATGAGVQIGEVTRRVDEYLLKSLRLETSTMEQYSVQTDYYDRLQDLFGAPGDNTSLSHTMAEFAAALETLSTQPDKTADQSEVVRQGQRLTEQLRDMSEDVQELRQQVDKAISDTVERMNSLISEVGDLNDKIIRNSAVGLDVSDLRDKRDLAITELSGYVDIRYFARSDGDVVVFTSGGRTLVDNVPATMSHDPAAVVSATSTHAEGDLGGIYVGTEVAENDLTNEIRDGKIKGLITLRDEVLTGLQSQLDEFAAELRDTVNQIHNRGVAYPGAQELSGTRTFVDSTTSTLTFSGTTDTRLVLTDANGTQTATTTVRTLIGGASDTIDNIAADIETWLQANAGAGSTCEVGTDGKLSITLGDTTKYLGLRDETSSVAGSTHQDSTVTFDVNADGVTDETVAGFSFFFGLNDFFDDGLTDNIWETDSLASTYKFSTAQTYAFRDSTGQMASTVTIAVNDTVEDVVTKINNLGINVVAAAVPDGTGYRLRISSENGAGISIYRTAAGNDPLSGANLKIADVRVSSAITVRDDIVSQPSRVVRGALQWDADRGVAGEYLTSAADEEIIQALAEQLTSTNAFDAAGGLSTTTLTFSQYSANIVSYAAELADKNSSSGEYQTNLAESLSNKASTISGVNLDEEMAQLILYEQAYSAAARVITVIQSMFDALDQAV
ncbi:MAG: flagellar hook-associated protein FlgK [Magnetospirillum sp. WYHS-4]